MKRAPPTQEPLPLPPVTDGFHDRFTTDATARANAASKVVDLNKWKSRSIEVAQSSLVAAVCQRAAHLADVISPRSKR
jgi:hypothetical protein